MRVRAAIVVLTLSMLACGPTSASPAPSTAPSPPPSLPPSPPPSSTAVAAPAPAASTAPVLEPPLPAAPTEPIACAALGSLPVYEGSLTGEVLRLTAVRSGTADPYFGRVPMSLRVERADLDGDGTDDAIATWIDQANGEPECGNWGECIMTTLVHCDTGWAMVLPIDYTLSLRAGTTRTEHAGRRFRVLLADARAGDDADTEEGAVEETWTTVLAMEDGGYAGGAREPWFESERCAAFVRDGSLLRARDMCEQGLAAHPRGPVRGALYFDLGRVAEAEGRIADAREAYMRSLDARPGNAIVEARRAALGD